MSKTIHTPPTDAVSAGELTFFIATIHDIGRSSAISATADFRCELKPKGMDILFKHMEWQIPGPTASLEKLDGKLKGGYFILASKLADQPANKIIARAPDGSIDPVVEIDVNFEEISGFECHRLEVKGHKKKGHRRELRFRAKFGDNSQDAMAELESFMVRTGDAPGNLKVTYYPEAEQPKLPGTEEEEKQRKFDGGESDAEDVDVKPPTPPAIPETGTLASARVMGAKRGRLADKAN